MRLSERKKNVIAMNEHKQDMYDFLVDESNWVDNVCMASLGDHDITYYRERNEDGTYHIHDELLNVIKDAETFEKCVEQYVEDKIKCDEHWDDRACVVWTKMMSGEI